MKKEKVIEVKIETLLEHLKKIHEVIKGDTISEIPSIVFHNKRIIAKNDSCFYILHFDHPFEKCTIGFKKFYEIINTFKINQYIEVKQTQKQLQIRQQTKTSKKTLLKIPLLTYDKSYKETNEPMTSEKIPENFLHGLKTCLTILPSESLRFDFKLIQIKDNKITSADDSRCAQYTIDKKFKNTFYLSKENTNIILNSDFKRYAFVENKIYFFSDNCIASFSLPSDINYPNIDNNFFKPDKAKKLSFIVPKMKTILKRITLLAEGQTDISKICNFEVEKGICKITASNESGKIQEFTSTNNKNYDVNCFLNPVYLNEMLNLISDRKVTFHFKESSHDKKIIFFEGNLKMLLVTYRI